MTATARPSTSRLGHTRPEHDRPARGRTGAPEPEGTPGPRWAPPLRSETPRHEPNDWSRRYARRLIASDTIVLLIAVFGAQLLWIQVYGVLYGDPVSIGAAQPYATLYSICITAVWLTLLFATGSRDSRVLGTGSLEYRRLAQASFGAFGSLAIVVYLFDLQLARGYFLIALPVGFTLMLLGRWGWRQWLRAKRREGEYASRVVLLGSPESVRHINHQLESMPEAGYRVLGACLPADKLGEDVDVPVLGSFDWAITALTSSGADTIVVTSSDELSAPRIRELGWMLEPGHQHLIVAPSLTDIGGPRIHTRPVAGLPLIHVETPRYEGLKLYLKRLFDIVVTSVALALLSPLMLGIAALVKLDSPGPVLFRQARVGRDGGTFKMLKFRSMVSDAEDVLERLKEERGDDGNGVLFKMRDDPRITQLGRILRRYSLDELPQLLNVISGEMSLVGPRPPLASEVRAYQRHVHRRFLVKPGITGLWQVSGRSNLSWDESVRLDLYYVENWTITGDLALLWRTARAVVERDGAY